jgi:hypothetical protein
LKFKEDAIDFESVRRFILLVAIKEFSVNSLLSGGV